MNGDARFNFLHFLPYLYLPDHHKEYPLALGELLEQISRPGTRAWALPALSRGARAGGSARF
jgi:hypothetical protein